MQILAHMRKRNHHPEREKKFPIDNSIRLFNESLGKRKEKGTRKGKKKTTERNKCL